ncbi:uncharacterized protein si:ch211-102c2.4 isoform X2 [Engraulis encrasicolus]|uniref:uncharacterized protein si:ch211-102c2.4 isoform X2 n=1 Tax=Engraulis encrasicolus TaxID=184585 RepID=UPI002FD154F4
MRMWCLVLLIYLVMHTDRCISDVSEAVLCKFDPEYADLQRVWCKQDSEDCCTGYAFGESITALYNGSVEVNNTANAFTITVHNLTEGNGMYWCGLMFSNETIMKLAEKYFSADPSLFEQVWSILRLVLFAVLVLAFVSTYMLTRGMYRSTQICRSKQEKGD